MNLGGTFVGAILALTIASAMSPRSNRYSLRGVRGVRLLSRNPAGGTACFCSCHPAAAAAPFRAGCNNSELTARSSPKYGPSLLNVPAMVTDYEHFRFASTYLAFDWSLLRSGEIKMSR